MTGEKMTLVSRGDREIVITRAFAAPRRLLWDAYTKPEHVRRWLLGPPGWTMPVCEIDARVGGKYRYLWRNEAGNEMGMSGEYREVTPHDRIVCTEHFDVPWYPGDAVGTLTFVEKAGRTTVTQVVAYESRAARDGVLRTPMESGLATGYDRLEALLATLQR